MIASKYFLHIYFLLILTCVPYIFTSTLECNFPVCSETHVKAEYASQDPIPCKTHILHLTRQYNVNVLKQEHYIHNISAISYQQVSTTTTSTFYFFGAKFHSSTTDYTFVPSLMECFRWNRTHLATNVGKLIQTSEKSFSNPK